MKRRLVSVPLIITAFTLLLLTLTGCARKAVQAPPGTIAPQGPTSTGEIPPNPSAPTNPTADHAAHDLVPVYFGFDSYALGEGARAALDRNARLLREQSDVNVAIEGHCDERGTVEYNQALGERRAQAARDYLTTAGIAIGRIQIVSYGKERPFDAGHTDAAWASNRRAHFVVQ